MPYAAGAVYLKLQYKQKKNFI